MTSAKHQTNYEKKSYVFHPLEIGFCGYSGLGKTTLISELTKRFSKKFKIAYIKHDVHKFVMDHEGKDTHIAWQNGAQNIFISDHSHYAWIAKGQANQQMQQSLVNDADILFVEGHKNYPIPKIVFLDAENKILSSVINQDISHVLAYVGLKKEEALELNKPYFCRDAIDEISEFILNHLETKIRARPLYGLILAGGMSRRMGQDKALLVYNGKLQLDRCHDLLLPFCDKIFLSARDQQYSQDIAPDLPRISDRFINCGPLSGILSAQQAHPEAAWLVIACDLAFLDKPTLSLLCESRHPYAMATVFCRDHDFIEPLCAIYEPKIKKPLFDAMMNHHLCPRSILSDLAIHKIFLENSYPLANINTPAERENFVISMGNKIEKEHKSKVFCSSP